MDSKKAILWPVIISLIGHAALISASGMIDLRENAKTAEIFIVEIKEPDRRAPLNEERQTGKKPRESKKTTSATNDGWREDTVSLGSSDIKYAFYLNKIKRKILGIWKYPREAYDNNEQGVVVLKMSIDANGLLAQASLLSTSGSKLLDEDALSVVRTVAPFEPLPASYSLSRLHVVASFNYNLAE